MSRNRPAQQVASPFSPPPLLSSERPLLTADEVRRAIARIAHEILERTDGAHDVILVGLYHEGIPIAQRLAKFIREYEDIDVPVGSLDFTPHRDDKHEKGPFPPLGPTDLPTITNHTVIIVDDVLCTGRTLRAALDALMNFGRPSRVQAAVLIDRGHRELPVRADYVGKNVPTGHDEWVIVRLQELHGEDRVVLLRDSGRASTPPDTNER
jgi:pyrimidine operon attenuation protein / uracil phosphoribosyltransferase